MKIQNKCSVSVLKSVWAFCANIFIKRVLFILFFIYIFIIESMAQWNSWDINQQLNQMNLQMQIDNQEMMNALMGIINQAEKNEKLHCFIFPSGKDTFYAMIGHVFINPNKLEIYAIKPDGTKIKIPSSSCVSANGQTMTPMVFTPGMTVEIKRSDTGEIAFKESIPDKNSSKYSDYVRNGINNIQSYNSLMNSSGGTSGSGTTKSNSETVKTICSFCKGKGWIPGNSTPTYGNTGTYKCKECDIFVTQSHSHDRCPSCK